LLEAEPDVEQDLNVLPTQAEVENSQAQEGIEETLSFFRGGFSLGAGESSDADEFVFFGGGESGADDAGGFFEFGDDDGDDGAEFFEFEDSGGEWF